MAKHIVFILHGMGKHQAGWCDAAQATLREAYINQQFSRLVDRPFDDFFEFHEITYDEIIETQRQRWKEDATAVLERLQVGGAAPAIIEQAARLGASTSDDSFFNTHLLDVLLYRYIGLIRDPIRVRVGNTILTKLATVPESEEITWSFIAHSLGTVVIHDSLHLMFHGGSSTGIDHVDRRRYGPKVGLFVSNVSRLLQNDIDVYDTSLVRPSVRKQNGILEFYLNVHHKLDPFTKPKAFQPDDDWLDEATRRKAHARYQDIITTEITEPDVHGLEQYLANPRVHIPFFRALFGRQNIISAAEEIEVVEAYREHVNQFPFNSLRNELLALVEGEGPELQDLLSATKTFYEIIT